MSAQGQHAAQSKEAGPGSDSVGDAPSLIVSSLNFNFEGSSVKRVFQDTL